MKWTFAIPWKCYHLNSALERHVCVCEASVATMWLGCVESFVLEILVDIFVIR
jgi:hypothetical protein